MQEKGKEAITKWFAKCLIPLSVTDHPATKEVFQVFQPGFRVPSRRTLTRDIKAMGEETREDIKRMLKDVPHRSRIHYHGFDDEDKQVKF